MTVAFFSGILLWVYNFDTPDSEHRVVLFPTMERLDSDTANVSIVHRGGEAIPKGSPFILLTVQNATNSSMHGPFNYSDGWQEPGDWSLGNVWTHVFSGVPEDARVIIQVIDRAQETVVMRTELQRGLFSGGEASPIVGIPVVLPSERVVASGKEQFYIRAIAADYDNDLPDNGLVADLRPVWNGLGTVYLTHRGFGVYESPMITLPSAAFPGKYSINVTATDSQGHTDTNWALMIVESPDKSAPFVIITNPTSGEIAAGTARAIKASYNDPNGINVKTVKMKVWEDDIPLDTSTKKVTDTRVTFRPFGGFKLSSLYRVNVSVEDNNGNIGYAETVFRMSTYSQPGNPQGETSFDIMDRNWTFTTTFWHDDLIRVQLWSEVIERVDFSELRLIRTDSSNVYLYKDRFAPNLTVPPPSMSFPWYVYDATIEVQTGGAYGAPVPPGYYYLQIIAEYAFNGLMFDDKITIAILYEDGSMPNAGNFLTFNETGKWISSTNSFGYREMLYIEVHTETPVEHDDTTLEMAIITISEIYGDKILYREIPASSVTYIGLTPDGHVYRMGVPLTGTIDGAQWFYGANWYPLEVAFQTNTWHWQPHPVFGFKKKKATDIAFEAANQIKITRPADLAITEDDIVIYHADGTTLDVNATVTYGEELYINLTVWNLGDVPITNADLIVWAISGGVTLDYWELTTKADFWDPNGNDQIDPIAPNNYVNVDITWNTSKTGYDQGTLMASKIVAHVSIISPVIGGYGSSPIPETDYDNNDAEVELVPVSEGVLHISNAGYVTPASVDVGRSYFLVDKVEMTTTGGGVRILGMNLTQTGTAQDADISNVMIVRDINGDGDIGPGDYLVDSGTFTLGVMPVDIAMYVRSGRMMTFFILYDISPAATAGRSLGSAISIPLDIYVDPTATVDATGFPIASDKALITSNNNELTGVAWGPSYGFPGYPVVYRLDLSALNMNVMKLLEGSLTITDLDISVTGSGDVDLVWLIDDGFDIISFRLGAPTVTFSNINYIVPAATGRSLYVVLNVSPGAASGGQVGITITAADVTLSTAQDSVDPALNLIWTTDIAEMADFFEWKLGDPRLDVDNTVLTDMNIGTTDPTVDVYVAGLIVEWTSDMPTYTMRVYIDGVLKFEDDGLNHVGTGIYIPFDSPMLLDDIGKSFRIEFDMQVTKKQPKKKIYNDNDVLFTWIFGDGSFTNGGQYVLIDGYENAYDIYWKAV
jgi:hypothetical protein